MDQSSASNLNQQAMFGVENLINEQKTRIRNNQANSFIDQQSVINGNFHLFNCRISVYFGLIILFAFKLFSRKI